MEEPSDRESQKPRHQPLIADHGIAGRSDDKRAGALTDRGDPEVCVGPSGDQITEERGAGDEIVPPGTNFSRADSGWTPPAVEDPALRRR
jgi:hypothetical protein